MVISGQAVLLYGEPRLTKDIDITLGATLERLEDVVEVAGELELEPLVTPDTFTRETMILPCQHPDSGIRVDFIFSFSPYERQALERTQPVEMEGEQVRLASLEHVIIHKIVAARPRDLEDVKTMLDVHPIFWTLFSTWNYEFAVGSKVAVRCVLRSYGSVTHMRLSSTLHLTPMACESFGPG